VISSRFSACRQSARAPEAEWHLDGSIPVPSACAAAMTWLMPSRRERNSCLEIRPARVFARRCTAAQAGDRNPPFRLPMRRPSLTAPGGGLALVLARGSISVRARVGERDRGRLNHNRICRHEGSHACRMACGLSWLGEWLVDALRLSRWPSRPEL
jgi:hypothetical protein